MQITCGVWLSLVTLSAVLLFGICNARPAEETPENSQASDADLAETIIQPQSQAENSALPEDLNLHSQAEEKNSDNSKSGFRISLFQPAVKTRESVNLETESFQSKVLSAYDNSQKTLLDNSNKAPLPIVDTIDEYEKYGNYGDMFSGISRSIVNGYEAFSNIINAIIRKPQELARSFGKSVNAQLDMIGGRIVGL